MKRREILIFILRDISGRKAREIHKEGEIILVELVQLLLLLLLLSSSPLCRVFILIFLRQTMSLGNIFIIIIIITIIIGDKI